MLTSLTPEFVEFIPDIIQDGILYVSQTYSVSIHNCICGCKNKVVLPFGKGGWIITIKENEVSFSPSIGNFQFSCKTHYYIVKNQIVLC